MNTVTPLSILIASCSTRDKTKNCLEHLLTHTDYPYHIYVVDNASNDGSLAMLQALSSEVTDRVTVSSLQENIGYAPAIFTLYPQVPRGDICYVNSDVYVGPQWASRLQNQLHRQPEIAAVAPIGRGIGGWQDIANLYPGLCPDTGGDEVLQRLQNQVQGLHPSACTAKCLQGTLLMVKEEAHLQVGGLDPGCECGADDADWCLRARLHGWKLVVAHDTVVWHDNHSSFSVLDDGGRTLTERSWAYFNKKWRGQFDTISWHDLMENRQCMSHPLYQYEEW